MVDEATKLARWARFAKAAALLCFVLPWVTVSCAGHPIASASGVRLALGRVASHGRFTDMATAHPGPARLAVVLAFLIIALALAMSFAISRRTAGRWGLAGAVAAAALIAWDVLLYIPQRFDQGLQSGPDDTSGLSASFDSSLDGLVRIVPQPGFWLTLAALAAAAVLNWMMLQRSGSDGGG